MNLYEWQEIDGRLSLYFPKEKESVFLDWQSDYFYHLRQKYSLRQEPLAKALGLKGDRATFVWDLTCGTGKDTLLMLAFGCKLLAFERNPVIFRLLANAHLFLEAPLKERFHLFEGDVRMFDFKNIPVPDVLYLDPMYEQAQKKRKALPRKEMRLFRLIAGDDLDAKELLSWALSYAQEKKISRVVVKRSLKLPPLLDGVTNSYEGKSTAYDLYRVITSQVVQNS